MFRRLARLLPAAILLALPAATRAQTPAPVVVRAQVSDTGHAPMANVGVAIIWGRDSVVLAGVTNSAGRYVFRFLIDRGRYRDVIRDLKPNMLYNDVHLCGPTANVWVNGIHEQFGPRRMPPSPPSSACTWTGPAT